MNSIRLWAAAWLGAVAPLAAQEDIVERLTGRVPPAVVAAARELAASTAARGLPVEPLIQKALEGGAKGVEAEQVIAALRAVAGRLGASATALQAAGLASPGADAVEAGAFAINAGLADADITALAGAVRPPHTVSATLRVAGTLAAMGVPGADAVHLVTRVIEAGRSPADVLDLPAAVQAGVAGGNTPAQAAAGLGRAAAAPGHRGPPPHANPQNPNKPPDRPRPPHRPNRGRPPRKP